MAPPKVVRSALGVFFEYDTPKIVHIRSKKVGIINRFLQLSIIGYIIGYAIIYKKGYQEFEVVQSAVTSKLKGLVFSDANSTVGKRTWDVADYVIPPQESNAFYVMTNVIATPTQTQKGCPEDAGVRNVNCTSDADCEDRKGSILPGGNGPLTGKCVESDTPKHEGEKVCEIFGWCPLEKDVLGDEPVLKGSRNFTVFIKNNIEFPRFNVSRRNLPSHESDEYFKRCQYNKEDSRDKFCPIFRLETIVEGAGVRYDDICVEGGVMQIVIDWTCNLDYSVDECVPEYTFRRLDKGDYNFSKGFNFRYADHYSVINAINGTVVTSQMYRNLYKSYGIRFLITVQGKAGKFSIVPLLLNIGSGLALLGVATIICDIVVLYLLKAKNFYRDKKYLDVRGQDAFEVLEEDQERIQEENNDVKRRNLTSSQNQDS